jgi:uncharacterized protein
MPTAEEKLTALRDILRRMDSVLVAYSGGVDSTFLLRVAAEVLKDKILAVTERSEVEPPWDQQQAADDAASLGVRHTILQVEALNDPAFAENSPERCYFCKKRLFNELLALARREGLAWVADGSIVDDLEDYRPGQKAITELGVRSPLREAGLTKADIRQLSKRMNLPTWDKPSSPCLASRFPYGTPITIEGIDRVSRGEQYLRQLGIRQLRVRDHGTIARIEVSGADKAKLCEDDLAQKTAAFFKSLGYTYVCVDLLGYRTGSMNETLDLKRHE